MSTKAIINPIWVQNKDSSAAFESPSIELITPVQALSFQIKYAVGVKGSLIWQGTIFPAEWVPMVDCDKIQLIIDADEAGSDIVALTGAWLLVGAIRIIWVPGTGSTGLIDIAERVVPT